MIGRMNIPVRGGGGATLNVFAQSAEPTSKEGLWVNTSATGNLPAITKFEYEGVQINTSNLLYDMNNQWTSLAGVQYGGLADIPSVVVGTDIYLMGTLNGDICKKYSTTDNNYTQISNTNYRFSGASCALVGTDIYLFGGSYWDRAHKYDTLTDTYTRLSDIPFRVYNTGCVAIGTDIYLFGGEFLYGIVYKYDTLTDTYTQISSLPTTINYCFALNKGNDVYLFGYGGSSVAYKYNIPTDTWSQLTNKPSDCIASKGALIGNNIYFFGGYTKEKYVYKYNIATDTWTRLSDSPIRFDKGCCNALGGYIYLLGDADYYNRAYKYKPIDLINNYVYVINNDNGNNINLSDNLKLQIDSAFINNNGTVQMYPAYYGDGTQWNLLS